MTKRKKSNAPAPVRPTLDPGSVTTQSASPIAMEGDGDVHAEAEADAPHDASHDPTPTNESPAARPTPPAPTRESERTMVSAVASDSSPSLAKTRGPKAKKSRPSLAEAAEEAAQQEPVHGFSEARDNESERTLVAVPDVEQTVNVTGDMLSLPGRDDLDEPTLTVEGEALDEVDSLVSERKHLRGLLEALVFASDSPIPTKQLAKLAEAQVKTAQDLLAEIRVEYSQRGINLEEVAGGWVFRTNVRFAPFIRDLTKQRPIRLSRAQVETLAIIAYRQPMTRPEVDDVRGVDSGPVLKVLLERDLVRILGKRDEVGRPLIYGTTTHFLEFFGLKSLKDLPTLREFTELTDESRDTYEAEIGEPPNDAPPAPEDDHAPGNNGRPLDSVRSLDSRDPLAELAELERLEDESESERELENELGNDKSEGHPVVEPDVLIDEPVPAEIDRDLGSANDVSIDDDEVEGDDLDAEEEA